MSSASLSPSEGAQLFTLRRVRALSGPDQLRLIATAFIIFMLADLIRMTATHPGMLDHDAVLGTAMDVVAYVAIVTLLWQPRLGLVVAAVPLAVALLWPSTSMDAVLIALATAVALTHLGRRSSAVFAAVVPCYAAARVAVYRGPEPLGLALMLIASLLVGGIAGALIRWLRARAARASRSEDSLREETARIRADERRTLSRELHDVISHQLSTVSLQIMGQRASNDDGQVPVLLDKVDAATNSALTELRLLVRVLRDDPATAAAGTEIRELAERLPPTEAAARASLALTEAGFEPDIQLPAQADRLDMTVQRTLSRTIEEATSNILRHAPERVSCTYALSVNEAQVCLRISNPLASDAPVQADLGWGLRGLRERVDLTGGYFSAGPVAGSWVVTVKLPHD
ncbi:sensor histidine kinase [Nigerium massiliense]|uniref:sensor histidine kinase n=1 Tax=Nigerium massiliense TaxID=1522317 RepID=UPI0012FE1005|nr:histidine kinase [Nigerium massiliense]